jgi:hypothetical protein
MKALKLSGIALLCLFFGSCSKDRSDLLRGSSTTEIYSDSDPSIAGRGNPNNGNSTTGGDVSPTMAISFNPDPAVEGQPVTVTGYLAPAAGEVAPTCGKLQLRMWDGTTWVAVGSQADVTAVNQQVSWTFTPTIVGDNAYQFQVHYIKGGCAGYGNNFSDPFYLDVVSACTGLSLTGEVTSAVPAGGDLYEFKVTYHVGTCSLEFDKLKTQGGLTNGSTFISAVGGIGQSNWTPGQNTNQIVKWEELASSGTLPGGDRTYVVTFQKAWSGSGPITITGGWSVSASLGGVSVGNATFDPITYQ